MRILNQNKISSGTLTYSTQLEKYKFADAFADVALSRWGKFSANSEQYLQVTFSSATPIYYAYILKTNLAATASVVLQCSNNGFSSIAAAYPMTKIGEDWFYRNDSGLSYTAYRIAITDTTVTYPRLSKFYLGGYMELPGATDISDSLKSGAKSDKSDSGQIYGFPTVILKPMTIAYDIVSQSERDAIEAHFRAYDKITPAIVIMYEDSTDVSAPLYCNMTDDVEFKKIMSQGIAYQLTLKFEECK